jgi:hypothetical protein
MGQPLFICGRELSSIAYFHVPKTDGDVADLAAGDNRF